MAITKLNQIDMVKINCGDNKYTNKKLGGRTMYQVGNDMPTPESAYDEESYCDGIYTKFAEGKTWTDIQTTFVSVLPESGWEVDTENSGFMAPGVFSKDYANAKAVLEKDAGNIVIDPIDYATVDRGAIYVPELHGKEKEVVVRDSEQEPLEH